VQRREPHLLARASLDLHFSRTGATMRKALLWVDVALLLVLVAMVLFAPGQDPAGRSVLWFSVGLIALALGASVAADRVGAHKFAWMCAAIVPLAALPVVYSMGQSMFADRQAFNGSAYWDDPRMLAMANAINEGDTTAMRVAASGLDLDTVGRDGMTLLAFAIERRPDVVGAVLRLGADPNLTPPGRRSPLAQALEAPDTAFTALLVGGANANAPGSNASPLLFDAIRNGRPDRYTALVASGADVTRLDALGRTALMAAAESGEWTIALDLLARGVDRQHVAPDGTTLRTILERMRDTRADDAAFRELIARVEERDRTDSAVPPARDSA
jgi:hypothetical protein